MTSNDLIILEAINGLEKKIISLEAEMNRKFNELHAEIKMNAVKIEAVHDKVNMGFTLTTVFLGIIGGLVLIIPAIKALGEYFASKKKNYVTLEEVQKLIEANNSQTIVNAR